MHWVSSCGKRGLISGCGAEASHGSGSSRCGAQAVGAWASSLVRCTGFLSLQQVGLISGCGAEASHGGGSSRCGAQALGAWASVLAAHRLGSCGLWALEPRHSSCRARAQFPCGMWDLPASEIEGFFTTGSPGSPRKTDFVFISLRHVDLWVWGQDCQSL